MDRSEMVKEFVRPPFANYDIVVYFGCGLFALPFIRHYYLRPNNLALPNFNMQIGDQFTTTVVSTLSLLFVIYIIGHILAYTASQFVEKTMDRFVGKTSTMVLVSAGTNSVDRNTVFRQHIWERVKQALSRGSIVANLTRLVVHLPVLPFYVGFYLLGVFGFYHSRVPSSIIAEVQKRMTQRLATCTVSQTDPWFKALEGYVINNFPAATARMYNYLVISGLFRSVSLLFLIAIWFELSFNILEAATGTPRTPVLMTSATGAVVQLWGYVVLVTVYIFSLFSFLKFQRRYVEEAIFAFALAKEA